MLAASAIGISGGLWLAGWLSQFFDWRMVFIMVGLPGVGLGLLVWLFAAEPRRGKGNLIIPPPQVSIGIVLRTMWSNISLRWIGIILTMVPITGFAFIIWGASFFRRVHSMSIAETGFWLGSAMAVGLVAGNIVAGLVTDKFGKNNPRFNGWFAGLGLLAAFPMALTFSLTSNAAVAIACFVGMKFLMTLHLGPIIALSFAQVPVSMRAMMSATINMFIGLAGTGIGGTVAVFSAPLSNPLMVSYHCNLLWPHYRFAFWLAVPLRSWPAERPSHCRWKNNEHDFGIRFRLYNDHHPRSSGSHERDQP